VTVNSATQITASSPAGTAGSTVDVTVVGPHGMSAISNADKYSYLSAPTPQETLTVTIGGAGSGGVTGSGISCPGTCTASYSQGTSVTLTAAAASSSTFGGWNGACSGNGACTITMSAAESVAATFTTTTAASADLVITARPVGTPVLCTRVECALPFYFTITNQGPNEAYNVVASFIEGGVVTTLVGVQSSPSSVSCANSSWPVICTEPGLDNGQSISVTVTALVHLCLCNQSNALVYGSATSNTSDPNTANNSAIASYVVKS
jgi:hypothetical protein